MLPACSNFDTLGIEDGFRLRRCFVAEWTLVCRQQSTEYRL